MVLTYQSRSWLPETAAGIRAHAAGARIYVIDNNSADGSADWVNTHWPEADLLTMPDNLGYATAYNLGMEIALADGADWVVWCNSDVTLQAHCLEKMLVQVQREGQIGIAGPGILNALGTAPSQYMAGAHPQLAGRLGESSASAIEVEWVEGSFLMVSSRCYQDVGPMDPHYFLYFEEIDFCRRARRKGWKILLVPGALVRHREGASAAISTARQRLERLKLRNYLFFLLTDPNRSFGLNVLRCLRVAASEIRAASRDSRPARALALRVMAIVAAASGFGFALEKWRRDKAGGQPPRTIKQWRDARVAVHRGKA